MKKLFIIILIIIALVAVGLGIYFAWKKSREILTPPSVVVPVATQGILGQTDQIGKLNAISDNAISGYWIYHSASSTETYYFNLTGQLFKVKEGEDEKILPQPLGEIRSVVSDKDGKKIAVETADRFNILTIGSNGVINESLNDLTAVTFSPDSDKMAYLDKEGDLNVQNYSSRLRSSQTSKILNINFKDAVLQWIVGDKIVLSSRPSAFYLNESWLIDVNRKTIAPFISARGLEFNWSGNGEEAIKLEVNAAFNPFLSLIDSENSVKANFEFSSLPDKCFIAPAKVYCAISQSKNLMGQLIFPDDYLKRKVYFDDYIYEIDRQDNNLQLLYSSVNNAIDAYNLTAVGNEIFFINRYDGRLYDLELF